MSLALPALRERSDRGALIEQLLAAQSSGVRLTEQARQCLHAHAWPGNIRQLLNALRYAVALAEDGVIDVDCLPAEVVQVVRDEPLRIDSQDPASELLQRLRRHRWNISAVAAELGVARSTLYRQMKKYGVVQPNDRL